MCYHVVTKTCACCPLQLLAKNSLLRCRYKEYVDACWLKNSVAEVVDIPYIHHSALNFASIMRGISIDSPSNIGLLIGHFESHEYMDKWMSASCGHVVSTCKHVVNGVTIKVYEAGRISVSRAFFRGFNMEGGVFYALVV